MQDDILEEIRKRREELEKENEIFSIETNEETGEKTPVINFDKMPMQDQITLEINALRNGYVNEEMQVAKQQADKAEAALLENATRAELADYFTVYSQESNRAATSNDIIGYYQSEIMKSRIKNRLGEGATPKTFLGDTAREFGYNAKGSIADTANLIDMGYVTLTDNLDADVLYNVAKSTNGNLQNTLKNYGWGKDNYERLEKLREQYPNDDIIESLYNIVTKQNFQGDKSYFDSTVKYINQLTNSDRFQKFQREHTLDETRARENLKLQESMSYGKGAQFALDVAGTLGYMAPSIALGVSTGTALGNGITTKAGTQLLSQNAGREIAKQVGLTTMAAAAAGQSGTSTFNQGYEWNQVLSKAATDGMLEYVSEVVGGETLNKLLVGTRTAVTPIGRAIGSLIENTGIKNKGVRLALGILGDITAEAWEEMAVEMITPLLDEKILGKKIDDWGKYGEDIFNAGLQSIVPTLILGGMNRAQVSHAIKIQMENLTLAVETTPAAYISEEQKEKLLNGIVEAYDNAAHFLSDANSEEQYNQIVEETYKALNEATEKYKSAQELARLINARTNLEKSQQRESIFDENIQGIMQTQAAEETVNRLNNAEQEINDSIKERNLNTNLTRALSQNAFKKSSEQPSMQVKAGETYNVEFEGKPAEIIVRSIQPDKETGELMAVVEATLEGKPFYGAEPVVMPLTDLEKRITELAPNEAEIDVAPTAKGNENAYNKLKQTGSTEKTSDKGVKYIRVGRFTKINEGNFDRNNPPTVAELNNSPVKIYIQYNSKGSEITPTETRVYKNISDLRKDLPISWLNKNVKGYRITSLAGYGDLPYKNTPYNKSYTWYAGTDRIADLQTTQKPKGKVPSPKQNTAKKLEPKASTKLAKNISKDLSQEAEQLSELDSDIIFEVVYGRVSELEPEEISKLAQEVGITIDEEIGEDELNKMVDFVAKKVEKELSNLNKPTLKSAITNDDYLTKWKNFYDEVLAQIPEEEINEEALRIFEQKIGETLDMDAWDYVDEDTMEKARANAIERFLATPKGQELLEKYSTEESKPKKTLKKNKPNDTNDTKNQKFATDMETNDKSIIDRMIKRVMADPSLREEHDTTSIREIRELTRQFLRGRLGVGQYRDRAYGVYNPLSNWVRLRQISNIDTLMHETGHYIDDEVVKKMYESHPEMEEELRKLCEMAFPKRYTGKLKLMEGFAEATRYFMVAPKELVKIAPTTAAIIAQEFDKSPELSKLYPKLQKMCHDYINMTPDERVDSQVISGTPSNKVSIDSPIRRAIRTVTRFMFNKNEAATMFDERNEKLLKAKYGNKKSLPTTLRLFDNLRRANSSGESIKQQLTNGVYDPVDGKRVTKGLARIIEPFKEEAKAEAKKNGMSYDKYLNKRLTEMNRVGLAERTIELAGRSVAEGKLYETGIRFDDAKDIIDRYKNDTTLHKVLDDLRQVGRDIVDYAVKKGVIKQETANKIKKKNLFYIPLNRIMDGYSSFGSSTNDGATGSAFKALRGSDREIQNPLESFVGNWARVLKVIDDNYIRQQLVKVAHEVGDYGDFFTEVAPLTKFQGQVSLEAFEKYLQYQLSEEEFDSLDLEQTYNLFVPEMADKNKMTISYLQNGVRKYIKFANNDYGRPLYELLANLNARQSNVILNAISLFNQGIRLGATTLNPFFAIGNTLSDQFQAFLYSDGLVLPIVNIFFDAARLGKARFFNKFDIGNKSDKELAKLYRIYKESGASLSGKYKLAETEVMKTLPDIYGVSNKALFGNESKLNKVKDIFSNFGKLLSYFPEFSEEMTRFGEFVRVYDKLTKDGMKPSQAKLEAGIKAKEITQDFSIQGEAMQYLNKIIPFSAAKVGGLYRFNQEFKKHPARLTMRMGALIGMAMLLAELRHGDDEAEAYYEELNNRKKFDSFVFPIGGSEPFIMKKPQGTPRYFINLAEYMYDLATGYIPEGEEEKRFKDWLELSVTDQLPISSPTDMIPGFAQSLLENVLNVDFYYGSKIVPQELEKLDPRHQYNEYTSEIAKAIGNIFNVSPMQIDNFIEGTFAGMGSFALDTGDWLYDTITGNDTRVKSQSYAKSRLFADVYRSSESVNIVYDKLEKYETEEAEGRLTAEQQEDYDNLKVAKTTFTKISKEMKTIRTDSTLSTEQKAEKLDKLYEIRTDVARYYLGKNLLNPDNKDRVERYKYYPASTTYKYTVGNKKVDVSFEDEEIQEEYSKRLKDLYERELEKLKRKSTYKNATDSEKLEQEKNLLGNTRNKVNEIMKPIAYRKQRGG